MISEFAKEKVFWTREMNLKLVKFIQSRPNIWNPKHPKYSSLKFRDQTYSEFAMKYGDEFSGQAVKHRWTNIRSTFANYLRKLNASRLKPDGEEYKVNWHLWEPCQFLLKVNKKVKKEIDDINDLNLEEEILEAEPMTSNQDWNADDNHFDQTITNSTCTDLAHNLLTVFKGIQNDSFGLDNTQHGRVGRLVAKKLSQQSSYDAAHLSSKIMEILLLYHEDNPLNPNNMKSDC